MSLLKSFTFAKVAIIAIFISGCSTPSSKFEDREDVYKAIKDMSNNEITNQEKKTLKEIVLEWKEKSNSSQSLGDYIDYYLIRQAAINLLEKNINNSSTKNHALNQKNIESWIQELHGIDPQNRLVQNYLVKNDSVDFIENTLYKISPTSKVSRNFNISIYNSLKKDKQFLNIKNQFSLLRENSRISKDELKNLFSYEYIDDEFCSYKSDINNIKTPKLVASNTLSNEITSTDTNTNTDTDTDTDNQIEVSKPIDNELHEESQNIKILPCLHEIITKHNLDFKVHSSAASAFYKKDFPINTYDIRDTSELFIKVSDFYKINFLIGFDSLVVFQGRKIPEDLERESFVYSIRARYVPTISLVNALSAAGYTRLITGMDVNNNLIWLNANMSDYLSAMQIISAVDTPEAQVKINMEIMEVEQSLISEIGARIPQTINFALGDPTFRYYNYGSNVPINNNGLVTQNTSTGSVSLSSLLNHNLEDVVRAVIRDDGFRLAAKEQNFTVEISERPTLVMKSGSTANLNIGSRLPVITTGVSSNGSISESVSMLDLGININIDANVLDNTNVQMDIDFKFSNLLQETQSSRGTSQPHLNTRSLKTSLIVENGKSAILGGISSYNKRNGLDGLPGLSKNPLTNIFGGANSKKHVKSDLLILLTPDIVTPQSGLLHSMRNSSHGSEPNPGAVSAIRRSLENYINTSANAQLQETIDNNRSSRR